MHQREKKQCFFLLLLLVLLEPVFFFFVVVGWVVKDPLPMLLLSRLEPKSVVPIRV